MLLPFKVEARYVGRRGAQGGALRADDHHHGDGHQGSSTMPRGRPPIPVPRSALRRHGARTGLLTQVCAIPPEDAGEDHVTIAEGLDLIQGLVVGVHFSESSCRYPRR